MHLYIFPNAMPRRSADDDIKLNIEGSVFHFFHGGEELVIDTELLRDGSSTMVMNNTITGKCYVLYNFRELLEVLDMTPSEMLVTLSQRGFMQIDKCGGDLYVKAFLPEGEPELLSDTTDFSEYRHETKDMIHPLDWRYSWTLRDLAARLSGGKITLSFTLSQSDFWTRPLFVSHGGQTAEIFEGENEVTFTYIPTEAAYVGNPNCRYKGRAIDLARLIGGMSHGL